MVPEVQRVSCDHIQNEPAASLETESADTTSAGRSGFALDAMISKIERSVASPSFAKIEKSAEVFKGPEVALFGGGLVFAGGGDRAQILSKIQTKISRSSNEKLVRVDKLLADFIDSASLYFFVSKSMAV